MIQDWWLINDLQNSQNEVVCRYFFEHEKMDIWAKSMEISIRNGVAMVGKSSGVLCAAYHVVCIGLFWQSWILLNHQHETLSETFLQHVRNSMPPAVQAAPKSWTVPSQGRSLSWRRHCPTSCGAAAGFASLETQSRDTNGDASWCLIWRLFMHFSYQYFNQSGKRCGNRFQFLVTPLHSSSLSRFAGSCCCLEHLSERKCKIKLPFQDIMQLYCYTTSYHFYFMQLLRETS